MQIEQNAVELASFSSYLTTLTEHMATHGRRQLLSDFGLHPIQGSTSKIKIPHPHIKGKQVYVFEGYHLQKFIYQCCPDMKLAGQEKSAREQLKERFPVSGRETLLKDLPNSSKNTMDVGRVRNLINCLALQFNTSSFQVLLSFFEYCFENYMPLRLFDGHRDKLQAAIEQMNRHRLRCIALQATGVEYEESEIPNLHVYNEQLKSLITTPDYDDNTENGVSLSPLNHSSIQLFGREDEIGKLNEFLNYRHPFQVMFVIAPSGAGKTRLITQWLNEHVDKKIWQSGLVQEECTDTEWRNWASQPVQCDTLIIIDYIYRFKDIAARITKAGVSHAHKVANDNFPPKLRLIILDHVLPELSAFEEFDTNQKIAFGNKAARLEYNHKNSPLYLSQLPTKRNKRLLKQIIAFVCDEPIYSTIVDSAYQTLCRIDQPVEGNKELEPSLFARFPLFAILIGRAVKERNHASSFAKWHRSDLIEYYFGSGNRIPWKADSENGQWVAVGIAAATALQGLDFEHFFDILAENGVELDGDRESQIASMCNHIVSSNDNDVLKKYEPDIIGESFFLKFLDHFKRNKKILKVFFVLLCKPIHQTIKDFTPNNRFIEFIQRTARNLANENSDNQTITNAWEALLRLLKPVNFADSPDMCLSASLANMDVVRVLHQASGNDIERQSSFLDNVEFQLLVDAYYHYYKEFHRSDAPHSYWRQSIVAIVHYADMLIELNQSQPVVFQEFDAVLTHFETKTSYSKIALPCMYGARNVLAHIFQKDPSIDLNKEIDSGLRLFLIASYMGHSNIVDDLIRYGIDTGCTTIENETALMLAAKEGHVSVVKRLLQLPNIDLHQKMKHGLNAFRLACEYGHCNVIAIFLEYDCVDVNQADHFGVTPLMAACYKGQGEVVRLLLDNREIEVNKVSDEKQTALMMACENGHTKVVSILCACPAININLRDKYGRTALMKGCQNGHEEVVFCLLGHKTVKLNQRDSINKTEIIFAAIENNLKIVNALLDNDAQIDVQDDEKGSALMYACAYGHTSMVELLISKGASVNLMNSSNQTPLMLASHSGEINIVSTLIINGAAINVGDCAQKSPLSFACASGHTDIAEFLVNNGAEIDATDKIGMTALMEATKAGHRKTVQLLISKKASINLANGIGYTSLMIACFFNEVDIALSLINARAKLDFTDKLGRNALTLARESHHIGIVELLTKYEQKGT